MVDHILVARDFSADSERALQMGLTWAKQFDATLHLLAVQVDTDNPFSAPEKRSGPIERMRAQFKERSRGNLARYGYDPMSVSIKHEVMQGEAAGPAIVRYADENDIDLIVMGTTGRRGVRRTLMGSVAEEVVRTAGPPVCTVRHTDDEAPPARPESVVVPIDFSQRSRHALMYGMRLAQHLNTRLTLLHAIERPAAPLAYGIEISSETARLGDESLKKRIKATLNEWATEAVPANTESPPVDLSVQNDAPDKVILQSARTPEHLVVMATQGRTGMSRVMLGSVAEAVLRRARSPIITARSFKNALG